MADLDKVKRNIGRMVDQSAPEADIDEYLRSEACRLTRSGRTKSAQVCKKLAAARLRFAI